MCVFVCMCAMFNMQPYDHDQLRISFPVCEESDSSCGETVELEDPGKGGYHPARVGETFKSGRYRAISRLGSGHFSTVWLCFDSGSTRHFNSSSAHLASNSRHYNTADVNRKAGKVVALKIQKSAQGYTDAAKDEIKLLQSVREADKNGEQPVISLLDHFEHVGVNGRHICLVFEVMGGSLLHLIKRFNYNGVPFQLVRRIARDLLIGLDFLHTNARIIHTDVKPENILMRLPHDVLADLDRRGALFAEEFQLARKARNVPSSSASNSYKQTAYHSNVTDGSHSRDVHHRSTGADVREVAEDRRPASKGQKKRMRAKARKAAAAAAAPNVAQTSRGMSEWSSISHPGGSMPSMPTHLPNGMSSIAGKGTSNRHRDVVPKYGASKGDRDRGVSSSRNRRGGARRGADVEDLGVSFNLKDVINMDRVFASGHVAIVDLGNACWTDLKFTGDIQTRQYRSPEVILGAPYSTSADIWSVACLIFELLTGDYLFDPHSGLAYDRDDDHLALMTELLGRMPRYLTARGQYARHLFNRNGELRHVRVERHFRLADVLVTGYRYPPDQAENIESFLLPMLEFDPQKRATARERLRHPFVTGI